MPPRSPTSPDLIAHPSSSLYTLVENLRSLGSAAHDAFAGPSSSSAPDDASLVCELQTRVKHLTDSDTDVFPPQDAILVRRLASLIGHFHRLAEAQLSSCAPAMTRVASWAHGLPSGAPVDPIAALGRELSDLRLARDASASNSRGVSPVRQVEDALLWAQVDEELEEVLSLCRSRTAVDLQEQPPDYDTAWYDVEMEGDGLPQYEARSTVSREGPSKLGTSKASVGADTSSIMDRGSSVTLNEKMRMDLEAVTLAIDRLYLVAPQLHDQHCGPVSCTGGWPEGEA
ncbi:hypothetical protein DAEQUDRAFT_283401 [Daedalea quercina L-15889]|uniref:Uncharacterized protein n=1 Tax=Daedalea quercina L-15889 TaxID=1314783 RepID=A0A165QA15_9APHY|nr:hypothetical protein DAEQUDRAFT_283401 [Daedalea quercina L-15889]